MTCSFAQRWLEKERKCGFADISEGMVRTTVNLSTLDGDSRRVLAESGLPSSASPCLSFRETSRMPRIWEVFGPGKWDDAQKAQLQKYRVLGSDGAGNPICVDERTGKVWLLDHEDGFQTRQFVNSTVVQLSECLLLHMGERDADLFINAVRDVDALALSVKCFWWHEAACLRENGG